MTATNSSREDLFLTAARCADCPNPACAQACPEQIDLKALFEFIAAQAPLSLVLQRRQGEAETFAGDAIHNSFN